MKEVWFKAKSYGWGWYPCAWQGVLIILAYASIIGLIITIIDKQFLPQRTEVILEMILILFSSLALLIICYRKGEKPHWRWGCKK